MTSSDVLFSMKIAENRHHLPHQHFPIFSFRYEDQTVDLYMMALSLLRSRGHGSTQRTVVFSFNHFPNCITTIDRYLLYILFLILFKKSQPFANGSALP